MRRRARSNQTGSHRGFDSWKQVKRDAFLPLLGLCSAVVCPSCAPALVACFDSEDIPSSSSDRERSVIAAESTARVHGVGFKMGSASRWTSNRLEIGARCVQCGAIELCFPPPTAPRHEVEDLFSRLQESAHGPRTPTVSRHCVVVARWCSARARSPMRWRVRDVACDVVSQQACMRIQSSNANRTQSFLSSSEY